MVHTKYVYSNDDQRRVYQIVNFMTPVAKNLVLGLVHISHIVKIQYFLKYLLFFWAHTIQSKYNGMMAKEGSTEIVNFMNPGTGVL